MVRLILCGAFITTAFVLCGQTGDTYLDLMKKGDALRKTQQWEDALSCYRDAAGHTGGDLKETAIAQYRVGQMYEQQNDSLNALDWYRSSLLSYEYDDTKAAIKRLELSNEGRVVPAEEIKRGLSVKHKSQRVQPAIDLYIHFDSNKDTLTPEGESQVAALAEALKDPAFANDRFGVIGHTDVHGSDEYNLDLSRRRAARVIATLRERFGFTPARFDLIGMGKRQLLTAGVTLEDDRLNRRVEIKKLRIQ